MHFRILKLCNAEIYNEIRSIIKLYKYKETRKFKFLELEFRFILKEV